MKFKDLIDFFFVYGKPKKKTLIIIPCFNEVELLFKHLRFLSFQTTQDFDIILVLGKGFDTNLIINFIFKNDFSFPIIISRRKEDTGSAGGFFTGQLYAMNNKYTKMIFADVDCLPTDKHLLKRLILSKHDFVSPHVILLDKNDRIEKIDDPYISITYYNLISRKLVESRGLYYYPAYMGADDAEYIERLGIKRKFIDAVVYHPYKMKNVAYSNPTKHWLYVINTVMLIKNKKRLLLNLLRIATSIPVLILFTPKYGKKLSYEIVLSLLTYSFGKKLATRLAHIDFSSNLQDYYFIKNSSQTVEFYKSNIFDSLIEITKYFDRLLLKDVVVEKTENDIALLFVSIFARTAIYRGTIYPIPICNNKNRISWCLKLIVLPFIVFLSFIFTTLFLLILPIRRPNTLKFGLEYVKDRH